MVIDALANAIASAEGFFVAGSIPNRDDNPGDLRRAPWLIHPVIVDGFWKSPSVTEGIAGLIHQLALDIARGYTLRQLIYAWAPPSDNNRTELYLTETVRRLAAQKWIVDMEKPLWNYLSIHEVL